jgi:hypothetical protein
MYHILNLMLLPCKFFYCFESSAGRYPPELLTTPVDFFPVKADHKPVLLVTERNVTSKAYNMDPATIHFYHCVCHAVLLLLFKY